MKYRFLRIVVALGIFTLLFQNCSDVVFTDKLIAELSSSQSMDMFSTLEDTSLTATPRTRKELRFVASTFSIVSQPSHGSITAFDANSGEFTYEPNKDYYGQDQFDYSEVDSENNITLVRKIWIDVVADNDKPWMDVSLLHFDLNTAAPFVLIAKDIEDASPRVLLSTNPSITTVQTDHGRIDKIPAGFKYTPNTNFRGIDSYEFVIVDNEGTVAKKKIELSVGNPFRETQPAMAVRAGECVSCHASIKSDFIVDFGYGDSNLFFAKKWNAPLGNAVWGHHVSSDQNSNLFKTSWETIKFTNGAKVIVPQAQLPFNLQNYVPEWFSGRNNPEWTATNLKNHLSGLEQRKPASVRATSIVEKSNVYIGAPSVSDLRNAGQISAQIKLKFWPNSSDSRNLSGFAASGTYFTNSGTTVCDGDLFIEGTVFLKNLRLQTLKGCRIHATGPIFAQGAITYVSEPDQTNDTNLQLVSARLISMGVGREHCEAQSGGWYKSMEEAHGGTRHPAATRFGKETWGNSLWELALTRNINPDSSFEKTSSGFAAESDQIMTIVNGLEGLEDASCHGRVIHFERLMLVAPSIHSRYTGNYKGVIITEFPLFSLGQFAFEFDPVFSRVPVLPLIASDKYLKVQ